MHDAYESVPILEKLPLQIDCLAAWEDWLLVGTKPGHLLLYRIKKDAGTNRFEVTLEKSNKNFSKKIQQLYVVSQYKILVSLLENNIHVHDLLTFQQITVVSKARGASLFTCDLQRGASGEERRQMCVADREFHELQGDFAAPDIPKSMAWCENSICVGFKRDYYLIRVRGGRHRTHSVDGSVSITRNTTAPPGFHQPRLKANTSNTRAGEERSVSFASSG
uniref:CNH domain-containing protein n=1 Tax=Salarias fasciatus TaxID=181472 RepID=A0A672FSC4_SALFA